MHNNPDKSNNSRQQSINFGIAIAIGIGIGVALKSIAIGLATGIALAFVLNKAGNKKRIEDSQKQDG